MIFNYNLQDILDDDYVILERPRTSLPVPAVAEPSFSNNNNNNAAAMVTNGQVAQGPNLNDIYGGAIYSNYGAKAYFNKSGVSDLYNYSDDDKDKSSDDDTDSDNDLVGLMNKKRSRMVIPPSEQQVGGFNNPNCATPMNTTTASPFSSSGVVQGDSSNSIFSDAATKFQKQRKPNTVWSNIFQEDEICNALGSSARVGLGHTEIEVERGPETYYYNRARFQRQPRQRRDSDSSDISSEGLSGNDLMYLKGEAQPDEEEGEEDQMTLSGERAEHALPTSFTATATSSGGQYSRKGNKVIG